MFLKSIVFRPQNTNQQLMNCDVPVLCPAQLQKFIQLCEYVNWFAVPLKIARLKICLLEAKIWFSCFHGQLSRHNYSIWLHSLLWSVNLFLKNLLEVKPVTFSLQFKPASITSKVSSNNPGSKNVSWFCCANDEETRLGRVKDICFISGSFIHFLLVEEKD